MVATYKHVRCLFCETGREMRVVEQIEHHGYGHAIFPRRVKRIFRGGQWLEECKPLLPSYVFVFTNENTPAHELYRLPHVLRMLRYDHEPDGYLHGNDRELADVLLQKDGMIGVLEAVKEGSWISITDGLLKQMNGRVLQMDRRKQMAKIQLEVAGNVNQVWLSFECIELKDEKANGKTNIDHLSNNS